MNILYVGDVMGEMGMQAVEKVLPGLRKEKPVDLVIAQAENVTDGKGITPGDFKRLQQAGVDFCTGGNWSLYREEIIPALNDPVQPIIRPANYPDGTPGLGQKFIQLNGKTTFIISLLGNIVGKEAGKSMDNPLKVIDAVLEVNKDKPRDATVVNFHGDYSSEKVIIGHYLDGRVSTIVGDHWHVPTADARVLPGGSAYISDVGMCGALDASLGVRFDSVIPRWRDGQKTQNILETGGLLQFNAIFVEVSPNGLADSVEQIREIF